MSVFDWVLVGVCGVWIVIAAFFVIRRRIRKNDCADCGADCRKCERQSRKRK